MTAELIGDASLRMAAWQRWANSGARTQLGFAAIRGPRGSGRAAVVRNPEAEEIESLMLTLRDLDPEIFFALMQRFHYQASDQEGASRCFCGVSGYRGRVRCGLYWIAGCVRAGFSTKYDR